MADLEILFAIPSTLEDRIDQRLHVEDLRKLGRALENCSSKHWDELARCYFCLTTADIENIDNDYKNYRTLKILHMVEKWHENNQDKATPRQVAEILDKADLCLMKQLWWLEYQDQEIKCRVKGFQDERHTLMIKFKELKMTDENLTKLFFKLHLHDKEDSIKKRYPFNLTKQLVSLFDWWTEKYGYIEASKSRLIEALRSTGMTKEACVLSGEVHEPGATSSVLVPNTSGRLEGVSVVSATNTVTGLENIRYDFGIMNIEEDVKIAERLQSFLMQRKFSVCRFDNYVSPDGVGVTKVDKHTNFCNDCICILRVTTPAYIKCKGYDNFYDTNAFHIAIEKERKNFITVIPKEHLNPEPKLPSVLRAYDSLLENDDFEISLNATYQRIKKKLLQKP